MSLRPRWFVFVVAALAAGLGGVAVVAAAPPAPVTIAHPTPDPAPVPFGEGADLFTQNCVTCHGPTGGGDGPASPGLNPKPRQLSSKDVMSKISDEQIVKVLKGGGAATGKSPLMPSFGHLKDAQIKALLAHIRSLCGCSFKP
jgi:mono/diheme cytochrome c family protein